MLAVGDYTLSAAGDGIAAIADIPFSVFAIPPPGMPVLSEEVLPGNGIGNADHIKGYTLTVDVSHSGFEGSDEISLLADGTPLTGISPADSQPVSAATGNKLTFEVVANSQLAGVNVYEISARVEGTRSGSDEMSDSTTSLSLMVTQDVDEDDDRLIELATAAMVGHTRNDLAGTSYDTTTAAGGGSTTGCSGVCAGYELTGDVALSGNWTPIGTDANKFSTTFEGNGHSITGMNMNFASTSTSMINGMGFFGVISDASVVRNLFVSGSIDDARGTSFVANGIHGGLAAVNEGTILNSGANVVIEAGLGADMVGGLVGTNEGLIANSFAIGNVDGEGSPSDAAGGLVGINDGSTTAEVGRIRSSYATNRVIGEINFRGRLVGQLRTRNTSSTITYISNSFAGRPPASTLSDDGTVVFFSYISGGGPARVTDAVNSYFYTDDTSTATTGSRRALSQLQMPTTASDIYSAWSTNNWDFGTGTQLPLLKYAEHTETSNGSSDSIGIDCTPSAQAASRDEADPPLCQAIQTGQPAR